MSKLVWLLFIGLFIAACGSQPETSVGPIDQIKSSTPTPTPTPKPTATPGPSATPLPTPTPIQYSQVTMKYNYAVNLGGSCPYNYSTTLCTTTKVVESSKIASLINTYASCTWQNIQGSYIIDCSNNCSAISNACFSSSLGAQINYTQIVCAEPAGTGSSYCGWIVPN